MVIKPTTVAQYRKILHNLHVRWAREYGWDPLEEPWKQRPMEFCQWFIDLAASRVWSKRTYWLYRAACLWHFHTVGPIEAAEAIRNTSSTELPNVGDIPSTSSKKMKKLSGKMLEQLLTRLRNGITGIATSPIDPFIAQWLEVGIVTGLRPVEWKDAVFDRNTCTLTVNNAKFDAVRGNGPQRHIIFDRADHRDEITKISQFVANRDYLAAKDGFKALYDKCRKRLWYICASLWPNAEVRPSLYSPRHQFTSNMKKAGLSRAEIAALMGHRSDYTATCHYGRRISGFEVTPPTTPISEIQSVGTRRQRKANPHSS